MNSNFTLLKFIGFMLVLFSADLVNNAAFSQQKPTSQKKPFLCGTLDTDIPPEIQALMQRSKRMANARVKDEARFAYRISVDIDSDTYKLYDGDTTRIKRDVMQTMAAVSRIYETEVNIIVSVVNIHIQKNAQTDPYNGQTDIFKLLSVTGSRLQQTSDLPNPYDALIYLPTKDVYGAGGLGYLGRGANVSPFGGVLTIAHEMGHNLGAAHTHDCIWEGGPLDYIYPVEGGNCYENSLEAKVGTIMSYASEDNSRFHPQVKAVFRAFAEKSLIKILSAPAKVKLANTYSNPLNNPYLSFIPDVQANKYVVQVSKSASFDNISYSDTTDTPLIRLKGIVKNSSLFVKIQAINNFGESEWSNVSEIINGNGLVTPTTKGDVNLVVQEVDKQLLLTYSKIEGASGYEINIDRYFYELADPRFTETFITSDTTYSASNFDQQTFRWRVRATNGTNKSAWSDFQTVLLNIRSAGNTSFDYVNTQELSTKLKIYSLPFADFQTNSYTIKEKQSGEIVDSFQTDLSEFINGFVPRYMPKGLLPNKTYELTTKATVIYPNYITGVPAGMSQTSVVEFKTAADLNADQITYYDSRTGNDLGLSVYSLAHTENYMLAENEEGLTRLDMSTGATKNYNRTNTNGLISNRIADLGVDRQGNLWMSTVVSQSKRFSGGFPLPQYQLRKLNSETMELIKAYEVNVPVEYFNAKEQIMVSRSGGKRAIYKANDNDISLIEEITGSETYNHQFIDVTPNFYWFQKYGPGYLEVLRMDRKNKSVKTFSNIEVPRLFPYFIFHIDENERLITDVIAGRGEGEVLIFDASPQANTTTLKLPYDNSYLQDLTTGVNNTVYVLSSTRPERDVLLSRLSVYADGVWKKEIKLPAGFNNLPNLEIDKQGNAWLRNIKQVNKLTICDNSAAPKLTFEGAAQSDSLTLFADGCTNTTWKLTDDSNGFSQFFSDDNSVKIKNEESTIKVSCVQDGCVSNPATAKIGGLATVSLKATSKNEACPGDSLDISVALQGLFEKNNTLSSSLIFNGKTYETGTSSDINNIRIKIPDSFFTNGKATLRVSTSAPKVTSNDFTINILPRPSINIVSNDMICKNGELLLRATSIDTNVSFKWYAANSETISGTTASFKVNSAGDYRLAGVDSKGCSNETSKTIKFYPIDPKVTITGGEILCRDATLKLNASASGVMPFAFSWQQGSQAITAADSSLTIQQSGSYAVTATDKNGCLANATFTVKASTLPEAVITSENNANLIPIDGMTLQVTAAPSRSYLWYKNDQPLSGETKNTLTIQEAGNYKVKLTEGNCQFTTEAINFALVLALEELIKDDKVIVYPNPVQDELSIEFKDFKNYKYNILYLYSGSGQLIKQYEVTGKKLSIDVSQLPAGAYFFKNTAEGTLFGKFVKR